MEIGCDWLSASLEWLYSILVWTKGFVFGPDLPWLKGKTSMEENRYLSGEAQDIKDKNGERERGCKISDVLFFFRSKLPP